MLAIGIVAILCLFIGYIALRRTAIGADVDQGLLEAHAFGGLAVDWITAKFRELRPRVMRAGYAIAGVLAGTVIAVAAMMIAGENGTPFQTPFWAGAVVMIVAAISCVAVIRTIRQPQGQESLLELMGITAAVMIVTGLVATIVAAFSHSSSLGFTGSGLLLAGIYLTRWYARVLASIGVKVVDVAENVFATFTRLGRLVAMAFNREKLAELIKDPNISDQELYVLKVDNAFRGILVMALPMAIVTPLWPHQYVLLGLAAFGLATEGNWIRLEARGIDTTYRRRRSALFYETFSFFCALNFVRELILAEYPNLKETYWYPIVNAIKAISLSVIQNVFWLIAAVACALAIAFLPRLFDPESRRMRWIVQAIGGLMLLTFLCIFAWNIVQKPIKEKTIAMAVSAWEEFQPTVHADAKKPSVTVSWLPIKTDNAKAYRIERREIHETEFTRPVDLAVGTSAWEDNDVVRGKTYFYRITIIDSRGISLTSREQKITIPEAPPPASTATPAAMNATAPVANAKCTTCGRNPALSELCKRHPTVQGCP